MDINFVRNPRDYTANQLDYNQRISPKILRVLDNIISNRIGSEIDLDSFVKGLFLNINNHSFSIDKFDKYLENHYETDKRKIIISWVVKPFYMYYSINSANLLMNSERKNDLGIRSMIERNSKNRGLLIYNSSYMQVIIQSIILSELKIFDLKISKEMQGDSLLINRMSSDTIQIFSIVLFFVLYSNIDKMNEQDKRVKSNIIFSMFDYNCNGFIQPGDKYFQIIFKILIFHCLFLSDTLANDFLIHGKIAKDIKDIEITNDEEITIKNSCTQDFFTYRQLLLYVCETRKLLKEFCNFISHNFIFTENTTHPKLNKDDFFNSLESNNFLILYPYKIRNMVQLFLLKSYKRKILVYLDEIPKIIQYYDSLTKGKQDKEIISLSNRNFIHYYDLENELQHIEGLFKSEDYYIVFQKTRNYVSKELKDLLRDKGKNPKSKMKITSIEDNKRLISKDSSNLCLLNKPSNSKTRTALSFKEPPISFSLSKRGSQVENHNYTPIIDRKRSSLSPEKIFANRCLKHSLTISTQNNAASFGRLEDFEGKIHNNHLILKQSSQVMQVTENLEEHDISNEYEKNNDDEFYYSKNEEMLSGKFNSIKSVLSTSRRFVKFDLSKRNTENINHHPIETSTIKKSLNFRILDNLSKTSKSNNNLLKIDANKKVMIEDMTNNNSYSSKNTDKDNLDAFDKFNKIQNLNNSRKDVLFSNVNPDSKYTNNLNSRANLTVNDDVITERQRECIQEILFDHHTNSNHSTTKQRQRSASNTLKKVDFIKNLEFKEYQEDFPIGPETCEVNKTERKVLEMSDYVNSKNFIIHSDHNFSGINLKKKKNRDKMAHDLRDLNLNKHFTSIQNILSVENQINSLMKINSKHTQNKINDILGIQKKAISIDIFDNYLILLQNQNDYLNNLNKVKRVKYFPLNFLHKNSDILEFECLNKYSYLILPFNLKQNSSDDLKLVIAIFSSFDKVITFVDLSEYLILEDKERFLGKNFSYF